MSEMMKSLILKEGGDETLYTACDHFFREVSRLYKSREDRRNTEFRALVKDKKINFVRRENKKWLSHLVVVIPTGEILYQVGGDITLSTTFYKVYDQVPGQELKGILPDGTPYGY